MMKETMTIHKALSELKILDSRIENAIDGLEVVVANKHSNQKIAGIPVADFCSDAEKAFQSVNALINRRNAIKCGVTRSNAMTMVTIGGKTYSVAEAIDMKAKGTMYLSKLKDKLAGQYVRAQKTADMSNGERLDERADEYVKSLYSGAELKNMADEIQKVRDKFIAAQTVEIVDPVKAGEKAIALQEQIDAFMSDVDSALSVSNALTTIEVEYETK